MRHLVSFLRSPLGYIANFALAVAVYVNAPVWIGRWVFAACEAFCLDDGVQDEWLF